MIKNISGSINSPPQTKSRKLTPIERVQYDTLQFVYKLQIAESLNTLSDRFVDLKDLQAKTKKLEKSEETEYVMQAIHYELVEVEKAIDILCTGFEVIAEA